MYRLIVKESFSAAHYLEGYKGACAAMHGHNWDVELHLTAKNVRELGLVVDFKDVKRAIKKVLSALDHAVLNRVLPEGLNPTAENLAEYLYSKFKEVFQVQEKQNVFKVEKVCVWENRNACAEYYR